MITDDTAQKMFDFLNSTKIDSNSLFYTCIIFHSAFNKNSSVAVKENIVSCFVYQNQFVFKLKKCKYINILNIHLLYQ